MGLKTEWHTFEVMHKQRSFLFPANDATYNWLEASKDSEGVLTGFFSALVL